jgi:hypothetical protein
VRPLTENHAMHFPSTFTFNLTLAIAAIAMIVFMIYGYCCGGRALAASILLRARDQSGYMLNGKMIVPLHEHDYNNLKVDAIACHSYREGWQRTEDKVKEATSEANLRIVDLEGKIVNLESQIKIMEDDKIAMRARLRNSDISRTMDTKEYVPPKSLYTLMKEEFEKAGIKSDDFEGKAEGPGVPNTGTGVGPSPGASQSHEPSPACGGDAVVKKGCDKPPPGWICTRGRGHAGPCAAYATTGPATHYHQDADGSLIPHDARCHAVTYPTSFMEAYATPARSRPPGGSLDPQGRAQHDLKCVRQHDPKCAQHDPYSSARLEEDVKANLSNPSDHGVDLKGQAGLDLGPVRPAHGGYPAGAPGAPAGPSGGIDRPAPADAQSHPASPDPIEPTMFIPTKDKPWSGPPWNGRTPTFAECWWFFFRMAVMSKVTLRQLAFDANAGRKLVDSSVHAIIINPDLDPQFAMACKLSMMYYIGIDPVTGLRYRPSHDPDTHKHIRETIEAIDAGRDPVEPADAAEWYVVIDRSDDGTRADIHTGPFPTRAEASAWGRKFHSKRNWLTRNIPGYANAHVDCQPDPQWKAMAAPESSHEAGPQMVIEGGPGVPHTEANRVEIRQVPDCWFLVLDEYDRCNLVTVRRVVGPWFNKELAERWSKGVNLRLSIHPSLDMDTRDVDIAVLPSEAQATPKYKWKYRVIPDVEAADEAKPTPSPTPFLMTPQSVIKGIFIDSDPFRGHRKWYYSWMSSEGRTRYYGPYPSELQARRDAMLYSPVPEWKVVTLENGPGLLKCPVVHFAENLEPNPAASAPGAPAGPNEGPSCSRNPQFPDIEDHWYCMIFKDARGNPARIHVGPFPTKMEACWWGDKYHGNEDRLIVHDSSPPNSCRPAPGWKTAPKTKGPTIPDHE